MKTVSSLMSTSSLFEMAILPPCDDVSSVPITAYAVDCPAGALLGVTGAAPAMGVVTLRTTITLTSAAIPNGRTRSRGCRDPIGMRTHVYQSDSKGQARVTVNDRPDNFLTTGGIIRYQG